MESWEAKRPQRTFGHLAFAFATFWHCTVTIIGTICMRRRKTRRPQLCRFAGTLWLHSNIKCCSTPSPSTSRFSMELQTAWEVNHPEHPVRLVKNQNELYDSVCNTTRFVQESEYHLYHRIQFVSSFTDEAESSRRKCYTRGSTSRAVLTARAADGFST